LKKTLNIKAKIIFNDGQQYVNVETNEGKTLFTSINTDYSKTNDTPSTYFGSTGMSSSNTNNLAVDIKNPVSSVKNTNDYSSSLPPGIPKTQIPPGQEDLYILKSQVVPPVCPAPVVNCPNTEFDVTKCPPCAPCSRCPEPNFECKKVPSYKAFNQDFMPVPVLNDFSTFGM